MARTQRSKKLEAESELYAGLRACKQQGVTSERVAAIVASMFEHWGFEKGWERARQSAAEQIAPKARAARAGQ